MIYSKTNVQSIAMKADRPISDGLTKYITDDGLTKYLQKQRI